MIHCKCTLERDGVIIAETEKNVPDPFWDMKVALQQGGSSARVSSTVQRSTNFSELKVSFTISIDCPQTKEWIESAAKHAFSAAVECVNDGFSYIAPGLQPLEVPRT